MKPLFAKFAPAMVSEQPMSAAEDARMWRGTTGLHLLEVGGIEEDEEDEEEKEEDEVENEERRDTAVAMREQRVQLPRRVCEHRGGRDVRVRWSC